jgi:hypothetical protein
MAIIDLDKIIFKKPSTGIYCTECGGDLKATDIKKIWGKIISVASFGWIKPRQYQCENCKKKYLVI